MTQLILNIHNEGDLEALLPLLRRLKIPFFEKKMVTNAPNDLESAFKIIDDGTDFSAWGDPVDWQRAQREDRVLPSF